DGEDLDSLVGREGGERFEARLTAAVPLSEYLIEQLSGQTDIAHADGKARFIALARPLLEKLEAGVYRELLLERIAEALQVPARRLQQWLAGAPVTAAGMGTAGSREGAGARPTGPGNPARPRRRALGAGRGSLVTQAVTLLLHFPQAAASVSADQHEALGRLDQPGGTVLRELLAQQATHPG